MAARVCELKATDFTCAKALKNTGERWVFAGEKPVKTPRNVEK
jgi:hypothetical protein